MFKPGQKVTWMHDVKGGYGYLLAIPATVIRVTPLRVVIEALKKDGSTALVAVKAEHLVAKE